MTQDKVGKSYEGKAKRITPRGDEVEVFFKDDVTAFNATKHAVFEGKGALNAELSALLFTYLRDKGIANHFIRRHDDRTLICQRAGMFALEVVVRFKVDGSLTKRTGLSPGTVCEPPVIEFYYKRDDLGDPIVNFDHVRLLKLATAEEVASLSVAGIKAALVLHKLFASARLDLVDIKFEYGRTAKGIVLADEITPDTSRLHDPETGRIFDKDLFRRDAGDLLEGYREVHRRLKGVLGVPHV